MSDYTGDPSEYKVYWFSRDLVASRFGSYATKEIDTLQRLAENLRRQVDRDGTTAADCRETIEETILGSVNRIYGDDISKRYRQTEDLVERIQRRIETLDNIQEFILAAEAVVRTSEILDETARFGEDEVRDIVNETLVDDNGEYHPDRAFDALYNVDFEGEAFQLGAQRAPLIDYVSELMEDLRGSDVQSEDVARVVSGIAQEYERRAGQSRAATAGNAVSSTLPDRKSVV